MWAGFNTLLGVAELRYRPKHRLFFAEGFLLGNVQARLWVTLLLRLVWLVFFATENPDRLIAVVGCVSFQAPSQGARLRCVFWALTSAATRRPGQEESAVVVAAGKCVR